MKNVLKKIDKFLKWLGTDRNTFVTYILTLATIYVMVDRIFEMLIMFFTGIGFSYWGPITYTFALACPIFAFAFSGSSSFAKSYKTKVTFLYVYCIALYVVGISMAVQWINGLLWLLLVSVPNYATIVTEFSNLIRPAFQALAIYLPLVTFYPLFKWIFTSVNESKDMKDGINDYTGIDLSDKKAGWGPYTCENILCRDKIKGHIAKIPEARRFDPALIIGISGTGKTAMVFEPMIARDIEKKYFFKEVSKEMGFTALKTGIAHLNHPYNNDYLNENFNLSMLTPTQGKESLYKAYMNKMIYSDKTSQGIIYRTLGITHISPDIESTNHMIEVAENFNIPYNIIDPNNPNSLGLNPFIYDDPSLTAIAVSTVLKGMYSKNQVGEEESFMLNSSIQAVENLAILLKVMYPILHNDDLPTLEDMLKMLNDFDLVEDMCKKMEQIPELAEKYSLQIGYFKKHFYKDINRSETERFIYSAITQLDNLLRIGSVRNILCNRTNNIDFDKMLATGEVTFVCTRRGDLGATAHLAFGLFFILLMQFAVLRRPGNENTRIPHFLYIDDFPEYICPATEALYTIYRKYHVGTMISAQNITQLGFRGQSKYRDNIMSNSTTKLVFGGVTREESEIWQKEFGDHREWKFTSTYDAKKVEYDTTKVGSPKWDWKENIASGKLQALKFKDCAYIIKDLRGRNNYGDGRVDFLEAKYKEPHSSKKYDFNRFTNGIAEEEATITKKKKLDLTKTDYNTDSQGDTDPIKLDNTDTKFLFDNNDAIVFDLKKGN